jgi:hypothetical protein
MLSWLFNISTANAAAALQQLGGHYNMLFNQMTGKLGTAIAKWNVWEKMFDYMVNLTKQLINESRELIAVSTKYDIPIKKMGEFQMMAQAAGQSLGQVARNFRFLEMNVSRALLKPGGPQYQAFKELGISQEELNAAASDTGYMLEIVRSKVMAIGDEERRNNFLQSIFGANWQNMLPIIEQSKEAQKEMADAAYEYGQAQTASLATIERSWEEISQDLKPIAAPFAQGISILVTALALAIQGVTLLASLLKDNLVKAVQIVIGIFQGMIGMIVGKISAVVDLLPFVSNETKDAIRGVAQEYNKAFKKNTVDNVSEMWNTAGGLGREKYRKGADNAAALWGRMGNNIQGLGYSLGIGDEEQDRKDAIKEIETQRTAYRQLSESFADTNKQLSELYKLEDNGIKLSSEQLAQKAKLNATYRQEQRELAKVAELVKEAEEAYRKKYGAAYGVSAGNAKPRTAEEIKAEIDALKTQREMSLKFTMAATPKVAEMESAMAVTRAYEEQMNIAHEINDLIKNNGWNLQTQTEYAKKAQQATLNLMEKEKEHKDFLLKQETALREAERGRRESTIEMMQKRQQTFMARQGMTGMDKQGVAVSQAIDKLVRDQEHLARVEKDRQKTQADREAAKKEVDASAIRAQEELDKLSLMQFQYGASDAAKKGMGGGIDIRENQLTVAKSQLDILKKQLDLMYKQYGLNPADYGGAPMIMSGPALRAGRGGK